MAKFVLRDAFVLVNNVNLSDHCSSVTVEDKSAEVDFTSFGPNMYTETGQGMHDATITCSFFSDFAAASVHATLQPLYQTGGTFPVEIRPTSAARGTTNPAAFMTARMYTYNGIGGKVGDAANMDVPFRNAGTAGLQWLTA